MGPADNLYNLFHLAAGDPIDAIVLADGGVVIVQDRHKERSRFQVVDQDLIAHCSCLERCSEHRKN